MSNELMRINASEAMQLGKTFYESGLFENLKNAQQAIVKIMAGAEIGIPPFAAMAGIHVIKGKPTIGAGLMASMVKASGKYDYMVKESTDLICSIDYSQSGKFIGNSSFTKQEAQKAGTQNMDKFPKNMLFARAMSNGVKWFTPDVFAGPVYTPEEMNSIDPVTQDIPHTEISISATIEAINSAETIELLATTWNQIGYLQAIPEVLAAKEKRKAELKPITQEVPPVLTWSLSTEKQIELEGLIKNSTMSNADKSTATTCIAAAKNHIEIEQIELRLKSLQNV